MSADQDKPEPKTARPTSGGAQGAKDSALMMERSSWLRGRRWLPLLIYGLLAVAMTWPVAARLGTYVPGGTSDLWVHQWTFWWVKTSLASGQNPFFTDLLFYPNGVSLAYQNVAWLNIAAWLPLQAILGGATAYSLVYILVFALNAFSMFLFAEELTESPLAAFVAGIVFGFWPYTMSHYGHPNMMAVFGVPLALLFLKRTLEQDGLRDALLAGVFLALIGIARWQLLVMAAGIIAIFVLWRWLKSPALVTGRSLSRLGASVLVALLLMAPLAFPVVRTFLREADPQEVLIGDPSTGQTDLLAYVLPTPHHPLWSDAAERVHSNFVHNKVFVPFLGYTVLALASLGAVKRWKEARVWFLTALIYLLFALGAVLRVNGRLYPQVPMPFRLVESLALVRVIRNPDRLNVILGLPVAMLAALGTDTLLTRWGKSWKSRLAPILISGLILCEYNLLPYHTERLQTPSWYGELALKPGEFAVLALPMRPESYDKQYMFYQTTHRKPLVQGHVSRPPQEVYAFMERVPFLRGLKENNVMDPDLAAVSHHLQPLHEADIRYIVLHKDFASEGQLAAWQDWLTFDPVHQDEDLVVYVSDPQLGRDFSLDDEMTEQIGLIRAVPTAATALQGAVVDVDARWGAAGPPGADYDVCLTLHGPDDRQAEASCVPVSAAWPTSQWDAGEVVRGRYRLKVPVDLEPGRYRIAMSLVDSRRAEPAGETIRLDPLTVRALAPSEPLDVRLGTVLALHGHDLDESDDRLELTLYWQSLKQMETSYKTFVHLIAVDSGEIVAQEDQIPRDWTHPTTRWESGEVVEDAVTLSLEGIPSGEYRLSVGAYAAETGERLPARGEGGTRYNGDAVPLAAVRR